MMPRKEYYQANKKQIKSYARKYLRQWRKKGNVSPSDSNENVATRNRKYVNNPVNKAKVKARQKLNDAVGSGSMEVQICSIANCKIIGEAHHEDYSKPLEVIWLCKLHHEDHHHKEHYAI